jgi:erythromycin esterase-like protein
MVRRHRRYEQVQPTVTNELLTAVRSLSLPLQTPADLGPLLDRIGNARFVLLGEASHGTHEYYRWRDALSRRLIEEKGFSLIAVEGDWPDCYRVNRYASGYADAGDGARDVLHAFERWPSWMWANEEIAVLLEWLRRHNDGLPEAEKVGFYGLDVYSLWGSLYQVLGYLGRHDAKALPAARSAFRCFERYGEDAQEYARATRWVDESCEDEVVALLSELRRSVLDHPGDGREAHFNAEQNGLVVQNAERYYRTMVRGGPESWNVRDRHMVETLERLMRHHGSEARAIVWEHNTHVGDARFTDMAGDGMANVGQLVRERHGAEGWCWSASAPTAARSSPVANGRRRWSGWRCRRDGRAAGKTCCTGRARRTGCSCSTRHAARRSSSASAGTGPSASCTTRSSSDTAITCRPCCRGATTPSSF